MIDPHWPAAAAEEQNSSGQYQSTDREIRQFLLNMPDIPYLTDSLRGILRQDIDLDTAKDERLREKYMSV